MHLYLHQLSEEIWYHSLCTLVRAIPQLRKMYIYPYILTDIHE